MTISPRDVHTVLDRYQLVDGYPIVVDLEQSQGVLIHDSAQVAILILNFLQNKIFHSF